MIPLSYFLAAWVILLGIFGVMTLLTLIQMLKHGLSTFWTYASTFLFLIVVVGVVIGVTWQLGNVDWNTPITVVPANLDSALFLDE